MECILETYHRCCKQEFKQVHLNKWKACNLGREIVWMFLERLLQREERKQDSAWFSCTDKWKWGTCKSSQAAKRNDWRPNWVPTSANNSYVWEQSRADRQGLTKEQDLEFNYFLIGSLFNVAFSYSEIWKNWPLDGGMLRKCTGADGFEILSSLQEWNCSSDGTLLTSW